MLRRRLFWSLACGSVAFFTACSQADDETLFASKPKRYTDTGYLTAATYDKNAQVMCFVGNTEGTIVKLSGLKTEKVLQFGSLNELVQIIDPPSEVILEDHCRYVTRGYTGTKENEIPAFSKVILVETIDN